MVHFDVIGQQAIDFFTWRKRYYELLCIYVIIIWPEATV